VPTAVLANRIVTRVGWVGVPSATIVRRVWVTYKVITINTAVVAHILSVQLRVIGVSGVDDSHGNAFGGVARPIGAFVVGPSVFNVDAIFAG